MLNDPTTQSSSSATTAMVSSTAVAASNLSLLDAASRAHHGGMLLGTAGAKTWIDNTHGPMGSAAHDWVHDWAGLHNDTGHLF
jgi:hypothetical protein